MKEQTLLKIANYKQQLAQLDKQWWFEGLDDKFYAINYDRINEEIRRLENESN